MARVEQSKSQETDAPTDWQPEVGEIATRMELANEMGGLERVQRQHDNGKLTIRERIDAVLDTGTFHEIGGLTGAGVYEDGKLTDFTPSPYVGGLGKIDGRTVVVGGEDFTVAGGSADLTMDRFKSVFYADLARDYRVPLIYLHDGAGANVASTSQEGHSHVPSSFDLFGPVIRASLEVPVLGGHPGRHGGRCRGKRDAVPFHRHDARDRLAVCGWPACGQAGHRHRDHQGRARRRGRACRDFRRRR